MLNDKSSLSENYNDMTNNFNTINFTFQVVEHGMFVKHCKVEVYKNDFLLAENSNLSKTIKKQFSKADTLGEYSINSTYRNLSTIPNFI